MAIRIPLPERAAAQWLAGPHEDNLALIEAEFGITARVHGAELVLDGPRGDIEMADRLIRTLLARVDVSDPLTVPALRSAIEALKVDPEARVGALFEEVVARTHRGKPIRARTMTQKAYVQAIRTHTLTFGMGPAGTGKTFLAAAIAAHMLREKQINKVILTRPAVEAGESLGFLPGDLQAKVDPYFRPLYDAMYEMLDVERFGKFMERGMIEVAPLAYMRGRTLSDAFIILDEAQNTTPEQMKMFLTRIGAGSRVVVTGDESQVDLPRGKRSALQDMPALLGAVPDIAFVRFGEQDVVRHELVRRIVQAYDSWERETPP